MEVKIYKHELEFNTPGGTSRGVLHTKPSYIICLLDNDKVGYGELSLIPNLSIDKNVETNLNYWKHNFKSYDDLKEMNDSPALKFAFEMALLSLKSEDPFVLFNNAFTNEGEININGLVWMGDIDFMIKQLEDKIDAGFNCIKIKVGAIDFHKELDILSKIRSRFSEQDMEIRVDANGAFTPSNAMGKLEKLSKYNIHSIEQPIKQGQYKEMAFLVKNSPIPIALDEELIGVKESERQNLLSEINPQYIILKPSLLGGFVDTKHWIELAEKSNIKWWITSALEANIGLNAIAQFTNEFKLDMPQGLGTGGVFSNNIKCPLYVEKGKLKYSNEKWDQAWIEKGIEL
jgi:o-succinylbenzoate synthase